LNDAQASFGHTLCPSTSLAGAVTGLVGRTFSMLLKNFSRAPKRPYGLTMAVVSNYILGHGFLAPDTPTASPFTEQKDESVFGFRTERVSVFSW
jgi:hypothetical protein